MDAVVEAPAAGHRLNLRVISFRTDPGRDEPAMLAQELVSDGRYAEAVELTAAALERDPHDPDLLLTHGVALAHVGQLSTAQLALMRAAKAEPGWAEPWRHLAEVLMTRGKPERALQVVEHALSIEPDDATLVQIQRAASLIVRGRRYADEGGGEEPAMLAQQLLAAGHVELAFEVTRAALTEEVDDEDLLVVHARAAIALEDLDEALSVLRTATFTAPDWAEAWRLLAEVHEAREEPDRAREAAERALAADPGNPGLERLKARLEASAETLVTL